MNSLRFEQRQLKYLAVLINCAPQEILYLCDHIKSYYGKRIEVKTNKETGKAKTYSDGTPKQRIIRPSYRRLKQIQRNIKNNILARVPLPPNVYGGVKGKSNILNAAKHKGNKYILTTDLQEFFPTVTFKQIHNLFLELGYTDHIAHWLTKLTSIEFELPQGTPTSTHIANLVFLPFDLELTTFCASQKITYTRYVDDLTFSSQKDFQHQIPTLISLILKSEFKISRRKTKYEGHQNITGIDVFNNYIDAPKKIKTKLTDTASNPVVSPLQRYVNNIRKLNPNAKTKAIQRSEEATTRKNNSK